MATKKPTPPSKYASQAVKDAYQVKLEEWQREQKPKKTTVADVRSIGEPESASGPIPPPSADDAAGGANTGDDGADSATGRADSGNSAAPVQIEVDEVPDPTTATDEQIAAVRERLDRLADDAAGHDERQRLLDWLSAVPTWIPVASDPLTPSPNLVATDLPLVEPIASPDPQVASVRRVYQEDPAADFRVVCDETNNSPEDVDNNRLNVDLVPAGPVVVELAVGAPAQRNMDDPVRDDEEFWDFATRGDVRFAKGGEFDPTADHKHVAVDAAQKGADRTVAAEYEHGNLLWTIVSRPDVKVHVTDRNVAAELVRLGLNNVFLDYPDRSAEPLHVARSVAESLPTLNVKRKRYTTKSGQTQNLGGVVVPAGPDGLVLEHDDHRLQGFVGYYLHVEDVTD